MNFYFSDWHRHYVEYTTIHSYTHTHVRTHANTHAQRKRGELEWEREEARDSMAMYTSVREIYILRLAVIYISPSISLPSPSLSPPLLFLFCLSVIHSLHATLIPILSFSQFVSLSVSVSIPFCVCIYLLCQSHSPISLDLSSSFSHSFSFSPSLPLLITSSLL